MHKLYSNIFFKVTVSNKGFSVCLSAAATSPLMPHLVTNTFNSALPPQIMCHLYSLLSFSENFICFLGADHHLLLLISLLLFLLFLSMLQLYHHYAWSGVANSSPALTAQATNQQLMSISNPPCHKQTLIWPVSYNSQSLVQPCQASAYT